MDWTSKLVEAAEECISAWLQNTELDIDNYLRGRAGILGVDAKDIERFAREARELVEAEGAMKRIGTTAKAELSKEEIAELREMKDEKYRDVPSEARDFSPPLRYVWTSMLGGDPRPFPVDQSAHGDEEDGSAG